MNDRQLRYMLEIADAKSISDAAKRLYISQPSLSAMVAKIEDEIGVRLFDRSVNPLRMTYAGECYMKTARTILAVQRDFETEIANIRKGDAGKLIIGCTPATSATVFVDLIPRFVRRYPMIQVELSEENRTRIKDLLLDGKVDMICSPAFLDDPAFEKRVLHKDEMVFILPESCEIKERERLPGRPYDTCDFSRLQQIPFILMKQGHFTRGLQDIVLLQEKLTPRTITETDNWLTCVGMVQNDMGATILPLVENQLGHIKNNVRMLCPRREVTRDLVAYWRKNSVLSSILLKFVDFAIRELA